MFFCSGICMFSHRRIFWIILFITVRETKIFSSFPSKIFQTVCCWKMLLMWVKEEWKANAILNLASLFLLVCMTNYWSWNLVKTTYFPFFKTPFHYAITTGSENIVRLLICYGADIHLTNVRFHESDEFGRRSVKKRESEFSFLSEVRNLIIITFQERINLIFFD